MPVNKIDRCRFFRIERYLTADCDNRIQHGSLAARKRPGAGHRIADPRRYVPVPMKRIRSVS